MVGFDEISKIGYILKEAGKIDEYSKILELLQQLSNMQKNIDNLEKENKDLKEKFGFKGKLEYRNNARYDGDNGPFCSRCWDKNKELIRIIPNRKGANNATCPECKNCFNYTGIEDQQVIISPDYF